MRRAAAALMAFPGELLAHPGHGAVEGHFHGFGAEHTLLLLVVLAFLAYAAGRK
jgi:hypothetical protein